MEHCERKKDPRSCYNSGNLGSLKEDGICGGLSLARIAGKGPSTIRLREFSSVSQSLSGHPPPRGVWCQLLSDMVPFVIEYVSVSVFLPYSAHIPRIHVPCRIRSDTPRIRIRICCIQNFAPLMYRIHTWSGCLFSNIIRNFGYAWIWHGYDSDITRIRTKIHDHEYTSAGVDPQREWGEP